MRFLPKRNLFRSALLLVLSLFFAIVSWQVDTNYIWSVRLQLILIGKPFALLVSPTSNNIPQAGVMMAGVICEGKNAIGFVDMGGTVNLLNGKRPPVGYIAVFIASMYAFVLSVGFALFAIIQVLMSLHHQKTIGFPVGKLAHK